MGQMKKLFQQQLENESVDMDNLPYDELPEEFFEELEYTFEELEGMYKEYKEKMHKPAKVVKNNTIISIIVLLFMLVGLGGCSKVDTCGADLNEASQVCNQLKMTQDSIAAYNSRIELIKPIRETNIETYDRLVYQRDSMNYVETLLEYRFEKIVDRLEENMCTSESDLPECT